MTATKRTRRGHAKDLEGIRKRGRSFQVRVSGGIDPVTGRRLVLTGSAMDEDEAISLRDRFRRELTQRKSARTRTTLGHLIHEWLDQHEVSAGTLEDYRFVTETFIIPALGDIPLTRLVRDGSRVIERFYADLRRCRRRCKPGRAPFVEHHKRCRSAAGSDAGCDERCKPHKCTPLGGSTMRHIHVVLNGSFKAAMRWDWISINPLSGVSRPQAPEPDPTPPSAEEAAQIIEKAWSMSDDSLQFRYY